MLQQTETPEPTFWELFDLAAKEEEAKYKAEKRQARIDGCGDWSGRGMNVLTGRFVSFQMRCGCWRDGECLSCLLERIDDTKTTILRALRDNTVTVTVTNNRAAIVEGLPRNKYLCLPIKTEQAKTFNKAYAIFIVDGDGVKVTKEWVARLSQEHWVELCNTPEGKRMSGTLGRKAKKKKAKLEPGQVAISYKAVVYHSDNGDRLNREAEKLALEETKELDPHDQESLESALATRIKALKKHLAKLGGLITDCPIRYNTVTLARLRWI